MSNELESAVTEQLTTMGVQFDARYMGETKRDDWQCDAWRVSLTRNGKTISTDYFTGLGHRKVPKHIRKPWYVKSNRDVARWKQEEAKPVPPHVASVLHSLVMDASANNESFTNWCDNYGYSSDSLKALDTYHACCDIAKQLDCVFTRAEQSALSELLREY